MRLSHGLYPDGYSTFNIEVSMATHCLTNSGFTSVFVLYGLCTRRIQWNPDFSNLLGKSKLVRIIEVFEKSGVELQCLTGEGKSVLVRIIGSFEKPRVREIGILL